MSLWDLLSAAESLSTRWGHKLILANAAPHCAATHHTRLHRNSAYTCRPSGRFSYNLFEGVVLTPARSACLNPACLACRELIPQCPGHLSPLSLSRASLVASWLTVPPPSVAVSFQVYFHSLSCRLGLCLRISSLLRLSANSLSRL